MVQKGSSVRILQCVITLGAAGAMGLAAQLVHAQAGGPPPGQPPEPPPEAYAACQGKAVGDAVTLTLPDGKQLQAVCSQLGQRLVARPAQPPGGRPPRPQS